MFEAPWAIIDTLEVMNIFLAINEVPRVMYEALGKCISFEQCLTFPGHCIKYSV